MKRVSIVAPCATICAKKLCEFASSSSARGGLRLYAAWAAKGTLNVIQAHAEAWRQTALPQVARN